MNTSKYLNTFYTHSHAHNKRTANANEIQK